MGTQRVSSVPMHPILFDIGGFSIHSYGALAAVGFLIVAVVGINRSTRLGLTSEQVADFVLVTCVVSLLGSRLLYVWQNPEMVETTFDILNFRKGGLVFYGALVSGIPFGIAFMRWRQMPILPIWDAFATMMPLGHAISRVGCIAAGCCWGIPFDGSWAVTYTDEMSVAPLNQAVHPVQLYEASLLVLVSIACNLVYFRRRFDGQVLATYLCLYAFVRMFTETYRGDAARGLFMPELFGDLLSYSQGVSLGVLAVGLLIGGLGWRSGTLSPEVDPT